jgi:phosphoserine aminotransferase
MARIFNFSAGPAALPETVLKQAADELLDWRGSGQSVMEMSHRGKEYMAIHAQAEADLRELMAIPANYKVLFLQGGATLQFEMIPMNLFAGKASADFVHTGEWAKKAIKAAKAFGKVNIVASSEDGNFAYARRSRTGSWTRMPPTCITPATKPSAASNFTGRPIRVPCRWSAICPPTSCRSRSMSPSTA